MKVQHNRHPFLPERTAILQFEENGMLGQFVFYRCDFYSEHHTDFELPVLKIEISCEVFNETLYKKIMSRLQRGGVSNQYFTLITLNDLLVKNPDNNYVMQKIKTVTEECFIDQLIMQPEIKKNEIFRMKMSILSTNSMEAF